MISVLIALPSSAGNEGELRIDTWLMSCRVLGRQVEQEVLNLLAEEAGRRKFRSLVGEYIPTAKNGMVKDHYRRLGFTPESLQPGQGPSEFWRLDLSGYRKISTFIDSTLTQRIPT